MSTVAPSGYRQVQSLIKVNILLEVLNVTASKIFRLTPETLSEAKELTLYTWAFTRRRESRQAA